MALTLCGCCVYQVLRALKGEKGIVACTYVESDVQKGLTYFSSPVELGTNGCVLCALSCPFAHFSYSRCVVPAAYDPFRSWWRVLLCSVEKIRGVGQLDAFEQQKLQEMHVRQRGLVRCSACLCSDSCLACCQAELAGSIKKGIEFAAKFN